MAQTTFLPPKPSMRRRRVATWVSTLGHPLLTAVLFLGYVAFRLLGGQGAAWVVGCMTLGVVLPIAFWNYRQVQRGAYTNFDVSVREQRRSFYPRLLVLLGAATALLFSFPAVAPLRPGFVVGLGLLIVCYAVNFWLKVSLHAALSFFVAGCVGSLDGWNWGLVALVLAVAIATSRRVLGRHSTPELLVGAALGSLAAGVLQLWR
ncbi:hypothetical protein [Hymenobacter sp. GOD-10R]|uniref:hypothetical protein n=1 Tax=Hymenobacter sp. GOD-10R TaxID=3093922 RepID=UPI002D779E60|nr:hypothetical protein [Hymenobacter sp. GOD-10R]WRQ30083.1 hypothetical protein SD425_07395 [Hymenobacter sp. GOD-10R]